jgi:formate hydrogenlyase transcriptional activator
LHQVANQVAVAVENALAFQELELLKDKLALEKAYLEEEVRTEHEFGDIVGESPPLRAALKKVETVAPTDSTVLVCGATGTGKELIARAVHDLSPRKARTFVKLNCAAIPTGLLESELFGHEKGAFTGAIAQKLGRFELANQGTLFLDEVGDIPLELQSKLLRVLQEQEFERLGGTRTIQVNVRLVAATNCDLAKMVAEGQFRSDLYYRLNVFPIAMPTLQERPEDIPRLVRHFTQRFARRMGRRVESIAAATMDALVRYPWPGNVRELQNIIERAVILSPGPTLQVPLSDLQAVPAPIQPEAAPMAMPVTLVDAEREHIVKALIAAGWVVGGPSGAAARLGMKRSTLQKRIQKLGIARPSQEGGRKGPGHTPNVPAARPPAPRGRGCDPSRASDGCRAVPHRVGYPTAPRRLSGVWPRPLRTSAKCAGRSRGVAFLTSVARDGSGRFPDEEDHEGRRPSRLS